VASDVGGQVHDVGQVGQQRVGTRPVEQVGAAEQLGDGTAGAWIVLAVASAHPELGQRAAGIACEGVPGFARQEHDVAGGQPQRLGVGRQ
jgi:hypothetical protein